MAFSFIEAVQVVHDVFSNSEVLQLFGYAASTRELLAETAYLPPRCEFILESGANRKVVISFCYDRHNRDDNHFFTVEVFNTEAVASFLIEEWMGLQRIKMEPYPFILSSYTGTLRERLSGFVFFLESQLCSDPILDVLRGRNWLDVPW